MLPCSAYHSLKPPLGPDRFRARGKDSTIGFSCFRRNTRATRLVDQLVSQPTVSCLYAYALIVTRFVFSRPLCLKIVTIPPLVNNGPSSYQSGSTPRNALKEKVLLLILASLRRAYDYHRSFIIGPTHHESGTATEEVF